MAVSSSNDFTVTRHDIIKRALRIAGGLEKGQTPTPDKINNASLVLNCIVKEMDKDREALWPLISDDLTLVAQQAAFTSSDGLATDIYSLESVVYEDQATNHVKVERINLKQYEEIADKTVIGIPQYAYLSNELDLSTRTLYLWPTPQNAVNLRIKYRRRLYDFDNPSDNPDFPAEWFSFLCFKLASELAEEYGVDDAKAKRLFDMSAVKRRDLIGSYEQELDNIPTKRDYF